MPATLPRPHQPMSSRAHRRLSLAPEFLRASPVFPIGFLCALCVLCGESPGPYSFPKCSAGFYASHASPLTPSDVIPTEAPAHFSRRVAEGSQQHLRNLSALRSPPQCHPEHRVFLRCEGSQPSLRHHLPPRASLFFPFFPTFPSFSLTLFSLPFISNFGVNSLR